MLQRISSVFSRDPFGGVSRARFYPDAFDTDQLYNLSSDQQEKSNVAGVSENRKRLREMKRILKRELTKFPNRPFGEFIPGGNGKNRDQQCKAGRFE